MFENCTLWHLRGKYLLTLELFQSVVFCYKLTLDLRLLLISVEIRLSPIIKLLMTSFYIFNLLLKVIFFCFYFVVDVIVLYRV